ncbi:MAG: hypothetical protein QM730_17295 [Anaerolineales bacterium]
MDEKRLRKFFHFTEEDLLHNRRNQFSREQIKRLQAQARKERKSAWESATILFVVAAAGLAIGLTIGLIAPSLMGRIFILLLMGVIWPSAWTGKGIQIIRAANRLQEPVLCQVSGPVHIARYEDEYTVQLGGLEFDVDGNPAGTLMEGDEYIIYYVEATEEILSIDELHNKQ